MDFSDCIFANKKYEPVNVINGLTGFTYLPALGDKIMMTSILECYERDNPDEVIFYPPNQLTLAQTFERLNEIYEMEKIFWASDADYDNPHERAKIFYIPLEAHQIAKERDIYPNVPGGVLMKQEFAKKKFAFQEGLVLQYADGKNSIDNIIEKTEFSKPEVLEIIDKYEKKGWLERIIKK